MTQSGYKWGWCSAWSPWTAKSDSFSALSSIQRVFSNFSCHVKVLFLLQILSVSKSEKQEKESKRIRYAQNQERYFQWADHFIISIPRNEKENISVPAKPMNSFQSAHLKNLPCICDIVAFVWCLYYDFYSLYF